MSLSLWFSWIANGAIAIIVILALAALVIWVAKEYLSLPGHFPVTDNLIGKIGTSKTELTPHQRGKVYVSGAYWDGISEFGAIHPGKDIQVIRVTEKLLVVRAVDLTVLAEDTSAHPETH